MLRILRVRLRAEWLLMLVALALVLLYPWFCGSEIRQSTDLYSYNQFEYGNSANLSAYNELSGVGKADADVMKVARRYGVDPRDLPEKADLRDVYDAAIRVMWDKLYISILTSAALFGFPILDGLAMLLLCSQFRKRRINQYLSAGYSRKQVFLSFTVLYFACAVVMWLLGSLFQLTRFHISFQPEEASTFRILQTAWLLYLLFSAALAYLAALFLRRPIVAFFASLGAWILLLLGARGLFGSQNAVLAVVLGVILVFLIAAIVISWKHFRKRGVAA